MSDLLTFSRYVALGKVAGTWHVVGVGERGGLRLIPLAPRRRRLFSSAELAQAARFPSRLAARTVGKACGFDRTYATSEPEGDFPEPEELMARPVIQEGRPKNAAEAVQLAAFLAEHPEDVAALHELTPDELVQATLLRCMRSKAAPDRPQASDGGSSSPGRAVSTTVHIPTPPRPLHGIGAVKTPSPPDGALVRSLLTESTAALTFGSAAWAIFLRQCEARCRAGQRSLESLTLAEVRGLAFAAAREHADLLAEQLQSTFHPHEPSR